MVKNLEQHGWWPTTFAIGAQMEARSATVLPANFAVVEEEIILNFFFDFSEYFFYYFLINFIQILNLFLKNFLFFIVFPFCFFL